MAETRTITEWVRRYYADLYRYAYRLSGSMNLAEDITQETFCKAQEKQGQLRRPERVKAWLYSILRNVYLQRYRRLKRVHEVPLEGDCLEMLFEAPGEAPIDEEALQKALNDLAEEFRTPLILFYFDDMDYRGIAEALDLPMGTVMSRLARAKAYLRRRLQSSPSVV